MVTIVTLHAVYIVPFSKLKPLLAPVLVISSLGREIAKGPDGRKPMPYRRLSSLL
jgi:hypothetical protein